MTAKNVKMGQPEIAEFEVGELVGAEYNPRKISDDAMAGLRTSLERFGCVEPIVVNTYRGKRVIVGGHQRVRALKSMGVDRVSCVVVKLKPAEERLLNLSLNNPHIQGQFVESIQEFIDELRGELGDDKALLDMRIDALASDLDLFPEKIGKQKDDTIPPVPKAAKTKPGDLYQLGEHRLLCGDSTNPDDVARVMNGETAALFATDPPYCVDYKGDDRPNGGKDWSDRGYREIDIPDMCVFYEDYMTAAFPHVDINAAMYLWHADIRRGDIHAVCTKMGVLVHQPIIWVKPAIVMGYSFYCWRHEPCLLMWRKGNKPRYEARHKKTGSVWSVGYDRDGDPTNPDYYTDVWEVDWDGKGRSPAGVEHPTVKPTEVFCIPMRVHTKVGDLCYEPFSGSGTQIVAAEKMSRRCYAIEKEPRFVDVGIKRWEDWTGNKAKKVK